MSLKLDINIFGEKLMEIKPCTLSESVGFDGEVNVYLLDHYLAPILDGNIVYIGDLDFSQFTQDDVSGMADFMHCASVISPGFVKICSAMQLSEPATLSTTTFC